MRRLFIDLEICQRCKECQVFCQYFYHPQNNGITSLREYATFALLCRHCEDAPCVNSCYRCALERSLDGHLKRYKMLCTSCKSCTTACPFGVILGDFIPYLDSRCDFCLSLTDEIPKCIKSCPYKAVELKEVKEDPQNDIYLIGENLAVHTKKWSRQEIQLKQG
ncbi:MAG: 4Fe-4S binding protein [Candidatus Omnitrophica bacterium]|nr:4Fe-4S binding protein [Candidatus Omnitrophota bacterium]